MAIKIEFDPQHNPKEPTLVLIAKSGEKIGLLHASNIKIGCRLNDSSPLHFNVLREDCTERVWRELTDFKIIWAKEWNMLFEASVKVRDDGHLEKDVLCSTLGEAELSQINLYNLQINTEDDIMRDDYEPSVLYDGSNPDRSILSKIIKNAPPYVIRRVDESVSGIQRSFEFNEVSICSALNDIAEEIHCLIQINCYISGNGEVVRAIDVFDLESYCFDCNHRGEFIDKCDKCGSSNIRHGYGNDTNIYISTKNLADEITFEADTESVKNCFRLEAGDELMTETVVNCNPGGSRYLWYISDDMKHSMSDGLVNLLNRYDDDVAYYQNDYTVNFSSYDGGANLISSYNSLIDKYSIVQSGLSHIPSPLRGYANLMKVYYDAIDFELLLRSKLSPSITIEETTAAQEAAKIGSGTLPNVSVSSIEKCTTSMANNAVIAMVKTIVNTGRFQVRISTSNYSNRLWTGSFVITSYSNKDDMATTSVVYVNIDDNYESYLKQKIDKIIKNKKDLPEGTAELFKLDEIEFKAEIRKYSLALLNSFRNACQSCLDIMVEQKISDEKSDMYNTYYAPYYKRISYLDEEIKERESELLTITGLIDDKGMVAIDGVQTIISSERDLIQKKMDFETYLGSDLWKELMLYRRDDVFKNENYISDGLNNTELFNRAASFINEARKEIYKSSCLQHTITAKLQNLLVMKEFKQITEFFEIGNWIRVGMGSDVFRLRLSEFEIDFDNVNDIDVVFTDVSKTINGFSDLDNILDKASAMSSTYPYVAKQAKDGADGNELLSHWVRDGLALTNMKIVNAADNQNISWDSHGLLCKEYITDLEEYDDRQLKLINRGLYLTDDNWRTSRAGIGNFNFYNPKSGRHEEGYGVIADTLIGNLILSEEVGVYNENNTISLDKNGVTITTDTTPGGSSAVFKIQRKETGVDGDRIVPVLSLNDDGSISIENYVNQSQSEQIAQNVLNDYKSAIESTINGMQTQIDGVTVSWFGTVEPTLQNDPAINWKTDDDKRKHVADIYYMDNKSGNGERAYRWVENSGVFSWEVIEDEAVINAMRKASMAKDTADQKRRTFLSTPTTPYDRGDVWLYGPTGGIMVSMSDRSENEVFDEADWQKADDYMNSQNTHNMIQNETSEKLNEYDKIMSNRFDSINEHNRIVDDRIAEKYDSAIKYSNQIFEKYRSDIGQYLKYDENGLTLGASSSAFKTVIDNQGMYFKEGSEIVSYVNNRQLHIPHAVIENTLILGNFFFSPREDGSVSLTWQN